MVKFFKKKTKQILENFNEEDLILVSKSANFFGVESKGSKQIRGNGVLILSKDELYFQMWLPKRIVRISLKKIKRVTSTTHHLRKTKFVDLLKIEYINNKGEGDSAVWWVKDLQEWIIKLKALKK